MDLNYILIGSSDKISLNSFIVFIKKALGKDFIIGNMHSLMSDEAKKIYVEDFIKRNPKGIFSYYVRNFRNKGSISILPEEAVKVSDIIIWFDLYSTVPEVFKDKDNFLAPIIQNWNKYIETLST